MTGVGTFSLVPSLRAQLDASRRSLDAWSQRQHQAADQAALQYGQEVQRAQQALDQAVQAVVHEQDLLAAATTNKKGGVASSPTSVDDEGLLVETQQQVEELSLQAKEQEEQLSELVQKRRQHQSELLQVQVQQRDEADDTTQSTIDALTHAVVRYKYTGLEFERVQVVTHADLNVEKEGLCFTFTLLDQHHPTRPCSFVLLTSDDDDSKNEDEDDYHVQQVQPPLPDAVVERLLQEFNDASRMENDDDKDVTDALGDFVRGMRQAFVEHTVEATTLTHSTSL